MIWTSMMGRALALAGVMALVCAAVGVWSYRTGRENGSQSVRSEWEAEKAATAKAHAQQLIRARDAQIALSTQIDQQRREADREKARILADHRAALDRLRDRPERPSGADVPDPAAAGPAAAWCTGARLYRPDGEFLAGEAARAAELQAELRACRARYEAARDALMRQ